MQPVVRAAARRCLLSLCCPSVSAAHVVYSDDTLGRLRSCTANHSLVQPTTAGQTLLQQSFFSFSQDSKVYNDRRLVGYTPEQMYAVVSEVQNYHKFVPFCLKSEVVKHLGEGCFDAELEVGFQLFYERYTSRVTLEKPRLVRSKVSDHKLFDHLDTAWRMQPGPTPGSCWLSFQVDFAFRSPLYKQAAEMFFQEVVKQMASAFEARCKALYGPSSLQRGGAGPLPGRQGGGTTSSGSSSSGGGSGSGKQHGACGARTPLAPVGKS